MPTPSDFSALRFTPQQQDYKSTKDERSGEYGQGSGPDNGVYPGSDMVPSPSPSKQFSSNKTGDPKQLLEQTRADVQAHADLLQAYGLTQPVAGLGVHPWLRDGLASGSGEPGNEEPYPENNVPFSGGE